MAKIDAAYLNIREAPRWADYEQNTAQHTYWKNGTNQSVQSNPRLRIEAGWYVAVRIWIEPPHVFDCRKCAKRNRTRNLKNLAVRNSENTCRLSGSSIHNRICNLQSAEPLYCRSRFSREAAHMKKCELLHQRSQDSASFFQMFWKIFQFSLFQCLKAAFALLTFQVQVSSTLGKQLSLFCQTSSSSSFIRTRTPY